MDGRHTLAAEPPSRFLLIYKLTPTVQDYLWGGREYISKLLGVSPSKAAELWMGAHPQSPSTLQVNGLPISLHSVIEQSPDIILGPLAAKKFGRLPYLFKILDVAAMLSIQSHPNRRQAREGFARENQAGIPLNAPHRNYKDDNHKPEMNLALTEFWMLYGFKSIEEIKTTLIQDVPEFSRVVGGFPRSSDPLRKLYEQIMGLSQEETDRVLSPLLERLKAFERQKGPFAKTSPHFWALRAARNPDFKPSNGQYNRGIFSIYLLNLVHLNPGEGVDQNPGTLHAYLEGVTLEIMANSANVLRGGLTPKHVDVSELLKTVCFESIPVEILKGEKISSTETLYRSGAEEFSIGKIEVSAQECHMGRALNSAEILLALDSNKTFTIQSEDKTFQAAKGEAIFIPFGCDYKIQSKRRAVLYRAMTRPKVSR